MATTAPLDNIATKSPPQLGAIFGEESALNAILEQQDMDMLDCAFMEFLPRRQRVERGLTMAHQTIVD